MKSDCFLDNEKRIARKLINAEGVRLEKTAACYIIENKESNNFYVGSTKDIGKRLNHHKSNLKRGVHPNTDLQKEYGLCVDENHFIVHVAPYENVEEAKDREQEILNEGHGNKCLLNISDNARDPGSRPDRPEIIRKMNELSKTPEGRNRVSNESMERWRNPDLRDKMIKSMGENITVDNISFGSVRQASRETGISIATIRSRLENGVCSLSDVRPPTRKVSVKGLIYNSVNESSQACGIAANTMTYRLQNNNGNRDDHYYLD